MTQHRTSSTIDITRKQRESLRRAARNTEYHLLLGAGASTDSISRLGTPLPGSSALIQQLCKQFGVPAEDDDLLWRIYDRAVEVAGEGKVYSWLRERFWGVTHSYWMEYYARSPWASVWTLNIDDTFESAYRAVARETSREIEILNWDDEFRQSRKLNIIHLHGVVDAEEPRKLVFSLSEYARSSTTKAAWPANFNDVYGNSPFVILGARIRDEPDIEAVVSGRRPTHDAPSFYVARTISPAMRLDLERWGLVPIEMTAEDFVLEWAEITGLDLESDLGTELELGIRIGQQFTELRPDTPKASTPGYDFLGGDPPRWADIQNGLAADLEWITKAKSDCGQIGVTLAKSVVLAYAGRRLTGRSTGLLKLGQHLRRSSWRTFLFRNEGRVDIDAVLSFAADGKSIALLFDGVADIANDVDSIVSEARAAGYNIVCVAVDEANREANIIGRISESNLAYGRVARINGRLSGVDAARLVDCLEGLGRLGILENRPDSARLRHFKNRDLFDSMAQIENAPGFGARVETLVKDLANDQKKKAVLLAAYASFVDRRLLVVDIGRMMGLSSDRLINQIQNDSELGALLTTDGQSVRARHRWMALKPIVKNLGDEVSAEFLREAIRSVSGRLNMKSLRERNPTAMLVGSFMSRRNLQEAFPGANLDAWYTSLIDIFGSWSARYWEQRAILAREESRSDASLLAKAESFALRATGLVADTYTFTTLGTVLLEKAATHPYDPVEYYGRGFDAFERAAALDPGGKNVVTWIAFLRRSTRVLERISSDIDSGGSAADLGLLWRNIRAEWERVYAQLRLFRKTSEQVEKDLRQIRSKYEALPDAFLGNA